MNQDLFEELKEKNSVARSARASAVGGKKKIYASERLLI